MEKKTPSKKSRRLIGGLAPEVGTPSKGEAKRSDPGSKLGEVSSNTLFMEEEEGPSQEEIEEEISVKAMSEKSEPIIQKIITYHPENHRVQN